MLSLWSLEPASVVFMQQNSFTSLWDYDEVNVFLFLIPLAVHLVLQPKRLNSLYCSIRHFHCLLPWCRGSRGQSYLDPSVCCKICHFLKLWDAEWSWKSDSQVSPRLVMLIISNKLWSFPRLFFAFTVMLSFTSRVNERRECLCWQREAKWEFVVSINARSTQIHLKIVGLGGVDRWLTAKQSLEIFFDRQRNLVADS